MANYITTTAITHSAALEVVRVALKEGAKLGVAVVVTVVDPSMSIVAFCKADGATPHSVETSRRKANTAASTRKRTGWMSEASRFSCRFLSGERIRLCPRNFLPRFATALCG